MFHTFEVKRALTYGQALHQHAMLRKPSKLYADAKAHEGKLSDCAVLDELWRSITEVVDLDEFDTVIPECVYSTMPVNQVSSIRRSHGVSAAFAFCAIAEELSQVDVDDDLAVRAAMKRGWAKFEQRRQEANAIQEGFGCDESQSWHTMRDVESMDDRQTLLDKMTAIAKLAGRMYESFGYHRRLNPNDNPEEVKGAKLGGDIDRVLPTEVALLADKDAADMQAMKILTDNAFSKDYEGVEEKTRGPLVLTIDESGSMHDGYAGWNRKPHCGRNTWAKACAVALTRIAWAENRPVRVVHFGNGTEVQKVPKGDHRAMFEMARSFLSGGTSFGSALECARGQVGDLQAEGFTGADIMLITDGEDPDYAYHNRQIDKMDADGVRLWTIAIGFEIGVDAPVRARAERYTYAPDRSLERHETATVLARGLDKAAMGNHDVN